MKTRIAILIIGLSLCAWQASSQTEGTLYFMNSLPQVVESNPSIIPRYKTAIGLPVISSLGGVYANSGFAIDQYITKVDGVSKLNLTEFTKGLAEKNYVNASAFVDVFRVGFRVSPKLYIMASSTVKGYNSSMIPKGLASLFADGTASLVGSYTNTSPQEEMIAYLSTGIGAAYVLNDKLTLGGRLKYLNGLGNISTEASSVIVQVDNNYHITVTGDARFKSSGVSTNYNVGDNLGKNTGWGLDLGVTYKFMDKLTVSAAINDLGFITWRSETKQYALDPAKANFVFKGFDMNQLFNGNENYLHQQLDSLVDKFKMSETTTESYTTSLPAKYYLSGRYELIRNLSVGALFFGESFRDRFAMGMTASLNKDFGKVVSTSLTYTMSNRSYNNIGLGVSFNLTPVQIYFIGDNLLAAPATMVTGGSFSDYLNSSQLLTLRAGVNLVFGWDKISKGGKPADENHNPTKGKKGKTKTTVGRPPERKRR